MNPYLIIGALIFLAVACGGSAYEGHRFGVDQQAVADQKQFDTINAEITQQKAEAHTLLEKAMDDNLDLETQRNTLKDKIQKDREDARNKTDALTRQLAFERLRFIPTEDSGCRVGGGDAQGSSPGSAGTTQAPDVLLPEAISRNLFQLALDADRLRDDYAACYAWATQVK